MFVAYRAGGVPITPSANARDVVAKAGAAAAGIASTPSRSHTLVQRSVATIQGRRRMATVTPPARKLLSSWPPAGSSNRVKGRNSATAKSNTTKNRSRSTSRNNRTRGICDKDNSSPCQACHIDIDPARRPSFSCRACDKLFHAGCVGYDPRKRQSPPPSWICPCCPDGERGPSAVHLHTSLKGKGTVTQKYGNQPWCPICLDDNRAPGMVTMGSSTERCPGCGMQTHGQCRAGLEISNGGTRPCDECQRRQDGVVPGNNPRWLRLQAARWIGGFRIRHTPLPSSETWPSAANAVAGTDSPRLSESPSVDDSATSSHPAAGVGSPDLNHNTRGAPVTPETAPDGAGPPNPNQALGGAPIQPPAAEISLPTHLNTTLSASSPVTWSSDAEEAAAAAAAVAAAAASFRPAHCLNYFPQPEASSASAASTVPSSPPLEVPGLSAAPTRTQAPTPTAPPAIKTEDGGQEAHGSGVQVRFEGVSTSERLCFFS